MLPAAADVPQPGGGGEFRLLGRCLLAVRRGGGAVSGGAAPVADGGQTVQLRGPSVCRCCAPVPAGVV